MIDPCASPIMCAGLTKAAADFQGLLPPPLSSYGNNIYLHPPSRLPSSAQPVTDPTTTISRSRSHHQQQQQQQLKDQSPSQLQQGLRPLNIFPRSQTDPDLVALARGLAGAGSGQGRPRPSTELRNSHKPTAAPAGAAGEGEGLEEGGCGGGGLRQHQNVLPPMQEIPSDSTLASVMLPSYKFPPSAFEPAAGAAAGAAVAAGAAAGGVGGGGGDPSAFPGRDLEQRHWAEDAVADHQKATVSSTSGGVLPRQGLPQRLIKSPSASWLPPFPPGSSSGNLLASIPAALQKATSMKGNLPFGIGSLELRESLGRGGRRNAEGGGDKAGLGGRSYPAVTVVVVTVENVEQLKDQPQMSR